MIVSPPMTIGDANTWPSTAGVVTRVRGPRTVGMERDTPVRDMLPWYVGQSTKAGAAAVVARTVDRVDDAATLDEAAGDVPPLPQAARTATAAARVMTDSQRIPVSMLTPPRQVQPRCLDRG